LIFEDDRFGDLIGWKTQQVSDWASNSLSADIQRVISHHKVNGLALIMIDSLPELNIKQNAELKEAIRTLKNTHKKPVNRFVQEFCEIRFSVLRFIDGYKPTLSLFESLKNFARMIEEPDFDTFLDQVKSDAQDKRNKPGFRVNLPDDEHDAIVAYTCECNTPEFSIYRQLNRYLVAHNPSNISGATISPELDALRDFISYLYSGLRKLGTIQDKCFRGISFDEKNQLKAQIANYSLNKEIVWSGFTSTSLDRAQAMKFITGKYGILFKIKVKHGVSIKDFSQFDDEEEILLLPQSRFKVTAEAVSDPTNSKVRVVRLEEIEETPVFYH